MLSAILSQSPVVLIAGGVVLVMLFVAMLPVVRSLIRAAAVIIGVAALALLIAHVAGVSPAGVL